MMVCTILVKVYNRIFKCEYFNHFEILINCIGLLVKPNSTGYFCVIIFAKFFRLYNYCMKLKVRRTVLYCHPCPGIFLDDVLFRIISYQTTATDSTSCYNLSDIKAA